MPLYEKGDIRIHYEEVGSGFPLLLMSGGGWPSTIAWNAKDAPCNPVEECRNEYRCITADLPNAYSGQSSGWLEIDRPWDAYANGQVGVRDRLGIKRCKDKIPVAIHQVRSFLPAHRPAMAQRRERP